MKSADNGANCIECRKAKRKKVSEIANFLAKYLFVSQK